VLTVLNPGTPPAFTSANATIFTTGVAKSFTVTTTGAPTAALAKAGALPAGLAFANNGNGTATISGIAAAAAAPAGSSQPYPLAFSASSTVGNASQPFTLTVTNPEAPLVKPPVQSSNPPGPTPVDPAVKLSQAKVQLPIGKSTRRVVKVLPAPTSPIECQGTLPKGAHCRVTVGLNVVVEASRAVRGAGTYRLTVHVASDSGTVRLPLIVQMQRPNAAAPRNQRAIAPVGGSSYRP
jgi:hypothetical protein